MVTKTKGHSNAMVDQIVAISTTQALIPIHGGATTASYRPLPSLILTREEWEIIGHALDWFPESKHRLSADVDQTA